ncbi:MAG: methionyl-tRNA formyltransferase [Candidatus Levybacteria bacterium]|nr:methionyl-tRNA formyltransferase [Candidatus Levybacteria bacterium]
MRIIFFGTPSFVVPILEELVKNYNVVGVVTAADTFNIRKKRSEPSAVKKAYGELLQNNHAIGEILTPDELDQQVAEKLQAIKPDLFIVAAYGKLIPENILTIPENGALNVHPSLLPKYRGPSPIQTAILNGDKETGITIIQMDKELDHGPILFQKTIPVAPSDTFASLHEKLFQESAAILPQVVTSYIQQDLKPEPQDDAIATYTKKIKKADGYIDLEHIPPPDRLERMIRAFYPWPAVWTTVRIRNHESRIMKLLPEKHVQIEGGKIMKIKDLVNGYPELKETIGKIFT